MFRLSRWSMALLLTLGGVTHAAEPDVSVATQPTYKRMLDTAEEQIGEKKWKEATDILDKFLELDETRWVRVRRGDERHLESAQRLAVRELFRLPPEGRDAYRNLYDPAAKKLLAEAKGDPRLLRRLLTRFEATPSGGDALRQLADQNSRAERWTHAAVAWGRAIDHDGGKSLSADQLLRAVLASRRAGDTTGAQAAWKLLEGRASKDSLTLQDRKVTVADLAKEVDKQAPMPHGGNYTPMFRSGPSRTAPGRDREVSLAAAWQVEVTRTKEVKDVLDRGVAALGGERLPVKFGASPLTARTGPAEENRELVIYRGPNGLEAYHAATGEIEWQGVDDHGTQSLLHGPNPRTLALARQWASNGWEPLKRPDLLLGNSTLGTLSSDGRHVYAVADLGLPLYLSALSDKDGKPVTGLGELTDWQRHNRLMAVNLASGKLIWEVGGPSKQDAQPESFFLGAPLPLDDHLYVVNQKKNGLRLLVLDARTGAELGGCALGLAARLADRHLNRRTTAVHLAHADGVLVCATQAGMVFGIDLLTTRPLWAYSYRDEASETAAPAWAGSAPLVADGKVILAPADDANLYALDLTTGALLWKQPAQAGALYVAGVHGGQVLVAGDEAFVGLGLDDGKEDWRVPVGGVTGLGVMGKDRYYLPVRATQKGGNPGLAVIDLAGRKMKEQIPSEKGEMLGNVVFCGDRLVSLTPTRVTTYKPGKE